MDRSTLPSTIRELLTPERIADLGPGSPNEPIRGRLRGLTIEELFHPEPVRQPDFAQACLAGLWLYHDFLEESHAISQDIDTIEGSYWHGIMHRREPDYSNAAYWFRKVGRHPLFQVLGRDAQQLAAAVGVTIAVPSPWDPFWFIHFCEECVQHNGPRADLARSIQRREWDWLFAYCFDKAVG